jgi:hypothetical protein
MEAVMARNKKRRFGGWLVPTAVLAVLSGVIGSGAMVWRASEAAFSGTTNNPTNNWTAGTVSLTDDDSNSAMFTVTNMSPVAPNNTGNKCIEVKYTGSVMPSTPVKLYAGALTGTLGTYLNLTIETAAAGTFASCTGFTSPTTIQTSTTIAAFAAARTNYTNGLSTGWTPVATNETRAFRFTWTLQDNNSAQGLTCGLPFTWEVQG